MIDLRPWYDHGCHESHETMDVCDVSLIHDLMCRHCHRCDKELEEPCDQNPNWQVCI
jgi:hypothetical protein